MDARWYVTEKPNKNNFEEMIMEGNLRKHILSEYKNNVELGIIGGVNVNISNAEISDSDEILMKSEESTVLTETIEESDPDEFHLYEEKLNSDRIIMDQTKHTYTIETSDEDEFLLM